MMAEDTDEIRKKIKKELDRSRYQHTLGVAYTAAALAMRYRQNIEKAYLAGLLHDCAKCIPTDKKFELCEKYDISLTDSEKENPALIHAKLGAYLAKSQYGIDDEDIIASIRTHTTGDVGMSMLQKIIFTADYIEPQRDQAPNLCEIRQMAFTDIDRAIVRILSDTLDHLNQKSAAVDPKTRETYEYYLSLADNGS